MKILLLVGEESSPALDEFYRGLHRQIASIDLHRLNDGQKGNLKAYFTRHIDLSRYDRVVFGISFAILEGQVRFLRTLLNPVFLDFCVHIDCLTRDKDSHLNFYKKILWSRVIVGNHQVSKKFHEVGIDVDCVPKGYTESSHTGFFVDATERYDFSAYPRRSEFVAVLLQSYPCLKITENALEAMVTDFFPLTDKTAVELFKGMKVVIFPDVGLGGYQAATFKVMSQRHLVFAYNQSDVQNIPMGFQDRQNIFLFSNLEELTEKKLWIAKRPDVAYRIAKAGQSLAKNEYRQDVLGGKAAKSIAKPMRQRKDYRFGLSVMGIRL